MLVACIRSVRSFFKHRVSTFHHISRKSSQLIIHYKNSLSLMCFYRPIYLLRNAQKPIE